MASKTTTYGRCCKCRSAKLVKFGWRWSGGKRKQRYLCNNCGSTTVKPKRLG